MKEKNFKIIFFTIIIILIIFAIYYIIKNQDTLASDIKTKKEEITIYNEINLGIIKFDTINPILSNSQDIQYISKLIYEPLINIGQDFKLEQGLATEWSKLDDQTYLVKLNENKYWQNKEKFTAKDIEYTINYIKQKESVYSDNVKNIEKIEIINEYIIKIFLVEPEEDFEYMLCFPIICKEENVGTGNFYISSINDEQIILQSKINEKKIIVKIYEDVTKLYNAFSKEEIDIFVTNNINYENYMGSIGYNKKIIHGREFEYLKFNLEDEILSNPGVVKAICYGINKAEIIYKIYNNQYIQAESPLQYGSYLYNNDIMYEYNINKAKQILEDSGWKYNRNKLV